MTSKEKAAFVHELIANVEQAILEKIPRMPENWEGIELREYVADRFAESAILHDRSWHVSQHRGRSNDNRRFYRRRAREYQNEVIVRNL